MGLDEVVDALRECGGQLELSLLNLDRVLLHRWA
jgi:hypothetical protein